MDMQKERPLSDFPIVIEPGCVSTRLPYITVQENGRCSFNSHLSPLLNGKTIEIRFTNDGQQICLTDATKDCTAITFPKSGSKKIGAVVEVLERLSIAFPAKYQMQYGEKTKSFQGVHIENPTKRPSKKGRSSARN